jgi:predicted Rossmann fold flavoprotein
MYMRVGVVGGGAAGFFAALAAKEAHPTAEVTILERSQKLLSKVKISGGGRCNVTNATTSIKALSDAYPRGGKLLKKLLPRFSTGDMMEWLESRGVQLVVQEDQHVFPRSQQSQTIIDCFISEAERLGVKIKTSYGAKAINKTDEGLEVAFIKADKAPLIFDKLIVATGGSPKLSGLQWLADLGHQIEVPVPSLFTFNMPAETITELMGIVVEPALVSIEATGLRHEGPLLVTHWGMSGPAILKLSAYGARVLSDVDYQATAVVNWVHEVNHDVVRGELQKIVTDHPRKQLSSYRPYDLPNRLWQYLLQRAAFQPSKTWDELGKKGLNKLTTTLVADRYQVNGKTTFKEEFVTCGGISLEDINHKTLESKVVQGLYFAGEVLDVDGITGGYNFQSAWTTGFVAGQLG